MVSDNAYHAQCISAALLLLEASNGEPSIIPRNYLDNFEHTFADGDISLVSRISALNDVDSLEHHQVVEILEDLSKVNPNEVPSPADIQGIDCLTYFDEFDPGAESFAEDNLGLSQKVERCLSSCIESVFGDKIQNIRDRKGKYPDIRNNFLCEEDGTFSGTFSHGDLTFLFEVAPTMNGWLCTYRLSEKSLENIPSRVDKEEKKDVEEPRKIRTLGWVS